MALLDVGYWHTTYWALNYWNPDYWLHYGTAVAEVGGFLPKARVPVVVKQLPLDRDVLQLFKQYLELKVKNA